MVATILFAAVKFVVMISFAAVMFPWLGGGAPADEGVLFVEPIHVVEGGPLSRPRAVSRELIDGELERWRGLLERLGNC